MPIPIQPTFLRTESRAKLCSLSALMRTNHLIRHLLLIVLLTKFLPTGVTFPFFL